MFSGHLVRLRDTKYRYILIPTILLAAVSISVAVGVSRRRNSGGLDPSSPAHAILKSACGPTRYANLCYAAVAAVPGISDRITTKKDVIEASLNLTIRSVEDNYFGIKKLIAAHNRKLTRRERTALHDCLESVDETLDELYKAELDLKSYPNGKTLTRHADDLKTLMSAAITNQETCLDGFSHEDADKHVRAALASGQTHVERMCSNALAMIKNMTDGDIAAVGRRLGEGGWPEWMSVGDRRMLQDRAVPADVVVAADGSGEFRTVAEAVAAAPEKSQRRYVIRIKAGVYRENVEVTKKKTNIMFLGDGRSTTIITGSRSVGGGTTTFKSATVAAVGERFMARGLTIQNTAGPSSHQAVALRVGSDLSAFYDCDILGYQDTLYVHSNRQFFINCLITGTVDFIFGNAAVVLQDCDIHARRPGSGQKNMVTAQGRTDPNQNTGIVIQKCRIGSTSDLRPVQRTFPTYFGRPWKEYSRTVILQSSISDVIRPEGWHEWSGNFALDTLYYREYQNTGPGSSTSNRVKWNGFKVITSATEAGQFTARDFLGGSSWLGSTGFPFSLDL